MPISQELLPSVLFAAGVAVFVFVMLRRSRGVFRRAASPPTMTDRFRAAGKAGASDSESADYQRWQVEMHELARDVRAEIDTKLRALSAMQVVAAQTLADLERVVAKAEEMGLGNPMGPMGRIGPMRPTGPKEPGNPPDPDPELD